MSASSNTTTIAPLTHYNQITAPIPTNLTPIAKALTRSIITDYYESKLTFTNQKSTHHFKPIGFLRRVK
jgi:hypothetical protein